MPPKKSSTKRRGDDEGKSQRPNFETAEREALLLAYNERRAIFDSPSTLPNLKRKLADAWKEITAAVNAVSRHNRSAPELQKKLRSLKSEFRSAESKRKKARRRTGGGESEVSQELNNEEHLLSQIVRPETIDGILRDSDDDDPNEGSNLGNVEEPLGSNESGDEDDDSTDRRTIRDTVAPQQPNSESDFAQEAAGPSGYKSSASTAPKCQQKSTKKFSSETKEKIAECMQAEHQLKVELYNEQIKLAKIGQQAAYAQKVYWETKLSHEFYGGQDVELNYEQL